MKVIVIVFLLLMSVGLSACVTDPYFRGARPDELAPLLSSAELTWSRDTAQQIAYRPRGGAAIPDDFEIPIVKEKGVRRVDVKTFIQRLEPK